MPHLPPHPIDPPQYTPQPPPIDIHEAGNGDDMDPDYYDNLDYDQQDRVRLRYGLNANK